MVSPSSAAPAPAASPSRLEAVLQMLREAEGELSGQELHQRLRARSTGHGLATVYRNLKSLQRQGLVRCRKLPSGESVYAPLERDDHHLTCVNCGRSEPLPLCPVHDHGLAHDASQLQGFKPLFHTFEVHGLCVACQQGDSPT